MSFTPYKAIQPLLGMKLQLRKGEKEKKKVSVFDKEAKCPGHNVEF